MGILSDINSKFKDMKYLIFLLFLTSCNDHIKDLDGEYQIAKKRNDEYSSCNDRFMECHYKLRVMERRFDSLNLVWFKYYNAGDFKMSKKINAIMKEFNEKKGLVLDELIRINDTCNLILHPERKLTTD